MNVRPRARVCVCAFRLRGADWNLRNDIQRGIHGEILRWFLDSPGPRHPYSIHNIIRLAAKFNKKAGEWFEPSTVSLVLKYVHSPCSRENDVKDG